MLNKLQEFCVVDVQQIWVFSFQFGEKVIQEAQRARSKVLNRGVKVDGVYRDHGR